MLVHISDITVKKRIRKNISDVDALADSIHKHGLLNPIILDNNYVLIAGFRRLQAVKQLGWVSVPATIVDAKDKISRMEIELDENIQRSDFTRNELLDGYAYLEKLKNPNRIRRIWQRIKSFFVRIFANAEENRAEKRKKNALLSLSAPAGLILAVVSGILHKKTYISTFLLSALNIVSLALFIVGLFFFIRFKAARKKAAISQIRSS
ncbi:ParB N-terminal domain-containing protein [Treponema sp. OMZ 840]|uniref:ParB N-terminal domain-containing protein n=1 Tax=Treponema sp. OMZ 840 TaxID=244313 RepID=UPI003D8C68D7